MRTPGLVLLLALGAVPAPGGPPVLTGGTGNIILGTYSKRLLVLDEATEKVTTEIPLATGIPWSIQLSSDRARLYLQNADAEHFEVVDIATRRSIDSFTLSEGRRNVRVMAFAIDPAHRVMTMVARTTTKLIDRFEIGPPMFIQYDLKGHTVIQTVPWSSETEPEFFGLLRYSPDGKRIYAFSDEILVLDATTLKQVATWDLSLPNEPGLGRFDMGSMDDSNDNPAFFSALFRIKDPIQKRSLLVVGRVNLDRESVDFFPLGPAPPRGRVGFALAPDRAHAYVLLQDIGHHELWTIDMAGRRLQSRVEFKGRPRMALKTSSNGKLLYLYEAGNTIDLYQADGFKYLRTITLNADMPYDSFHVVPRQSPVAPPRPTMAAAKPRSN